MEWIGAQGAQDSAWRAMKTDEPKMMRLVTVVLELLREDRAELTDDEAAGAWYLFDAFFFLPGHPDVILHAVQAGAVGLALAELRTAPPAEWISVSRNPSGLFAAAIGAIATVAMVLPTEHMHLLAATPRLLDVLLDGLKAYEAAGSAEDATVGSVFWLIIALYNLQ